MHKVSVTAPVNIATLKYWGKRDTSLNLPTNSSISVTLSQDDLRTLTTVGASDDFKEDKLWINGKEQNLDTPRTQSCLADLRSLRKQLEQELSSQGKDFKPLSSMKLHIVSENNFPTAAGLASSAAGFAALVFGIAKLFELPQDNSEISKIARKGSGSACRSLFGGYVGWEMGKLGDGSDSKAVQIAEEDHWDMKALICVVSDAKKEVPSTSGMQLTVKTSDLFPIRINDVVPKRYNEMVETIKQKDFEKFAELTMKDSNSFHATCLDSYPPIFYLTDTSKKIISAIHELNSQGTVVAYTFDAGPNAVLYYQPKDEEKVKAFLEPYLGHLNEWKDGKGDDEKKLDGVSKLIWTSVGGSPKIVDDCLIGDNGEPL
ncbi:diphosphomevalonate decarboxylase [[Candida] jaroonii]|uniref:Diphosphomevalonate decarboxylase n=1 Tax=[Candida] jaroonii TaxID=467808 RepID=A0ACA9Y1X3_9ASCO|nr:diphosphomevalonate decarboxylase [[Candida] jaroonii]